MRAIGLTARALGVIAIVVGALALIIALLNRPGPPTCNFQVMHAGDTCADNGPNVSLIDYDQMVTLDGALEHGGWRVCYATVPAGIVLFLAGFFLVRRVR